MKTIDGDLLERTMMEMGSSEVGLDADYKPEICDDCAMVFMDLINKANTLTINTLRDEIYKDAADHGLWEHEDGPVACGAKIAEEMFELGDAAGGVIEATKSGKGKAEAWEHYAEELADIVIVCFSAAGHLKIDIDAAIRRKMKINKERPWKHGKEEYP